MLGIAIDATAKREFPSISSGHKRFVNLVARDLRFATKLAFGSSIETWTLAVPGKLLRNTQSLEPVPDFVYGINADMWILPMPEIIYRLMRSESVHSGQLPDHIRLVEEDRLEVRDTRLDIPKSILMGLLVTTIVAETNKREVGTFTQPLRWHRLGATSRLEWLFGERYEFERLMNMPSEGS